MTRIKRFWRWLWPLLLVVCVIVGGGVLLQISVTNSAGVQMTQAENQAQDKQIGGLAESLKAANERLQDHGLPAVSTPVIVQGSTGDRGPGPTSDQIADAVQSYCAIRLSCQGPTGAASVVPGLQGVPGQDSTVPGPQGPAGADSQVPGPQGAAGADSTVPGPPAPAGVAGAPGESPVSWTYTDALGTSYTCSRTVIFDPASPTYECNKTEGVTP